MKKLYKLSSLALLILFCGLIYFPFIGEINLFNWDETLVASVSKSMFVSKSYLIPTLNHAWYLDKPPLFNWMQMLSYNYFGIKEYASRLPNAICGLLVVLTLYKMGRRIFSKQFGLLWAIIYLSLFLPQLYQKTGLMEPWFNFFIFLSLYNLSRVIEMRQERIDGYYRSNDIFRSLLWSAFACAGAIMTKGIEAYFVIILCYWGVFIGSSAKYGMGYVNIVKWTSFVIGFILIWVLVLYKFNGSNYFIAFLNYQWHDIDVEKASWSRRISFHFLILLVGCFPASILAFNTLKPKTYESNIQQIFRLTMVCCLVVVFLIATFVKHKVVHYSTLSYLPISFLAAYNIKYIYEHSKKVKPIIIFLLFVVGSFWSFILVGVPYSRAHIDFLGKYIGSPILHIALTYNYPWQEYEIYFGIGFFVLFLSSILLMIFRNYTKGIVLLVFSIMFYSQLIMIYYLPKIERLTQGAYIDFQKIKSKEKAYLYHYKSVDCATMFYSDSLIPVKELALDSIPNFYKRNPKLPMYLIKSKLETRDSNFFSQNCTKLYEQGLFEFYKYKQNLGKKKLVFH